MCVFVCVWDMERLMYINLENLEKTVFIITLRSALGILKSGYPSFHSVVCCWWSKNDRNFIKYATKCNTYTCIEGLKIGKLTLKIMEILHTPSEWLEESHQIFFVNALKPIRRAINCCSQNSRYEPWHFFWLLVTGSP